MNHHNNCSHSNDQKLFVTKNSLDVVGRAVGYLKKVRGSMRAVVLDIDDTLLMHPPGSNLEELSHQRLNPPGLIIYDQAISMGYTIFIVTARPDYPVNRAFTKSQLKTLGIQHKGLFMRPEDTMNHPDASYFKSKAREVIRNMGFMIVLNAGDNWGDLALTGKIDWSHQVSPDKYAIFEAPEKSHTMAIKFPQLQ